MTRSAAGPTLAAMTPTMRSRIAVATAGLFLVGTAGVSAAAAGGGSTLTDSSSATATTQGQAAAASKPKPKKYKNCTALRKIYKHGVGKKGAEDKVKGGAKPVKNFTVSTKTYKLNKKSDRDKDGIACEKR